MRIISVFLIVFISALAASPLQINERLSQLNEVHARCQADPAANVDDELLRNFAQNRDDPKVGAHMLCESKAVGFQRADGELDMDAIRQRTSSAVNDTAVVDRLMEACAVNRETPEMTAVNMFSCFEQELRSSMSSE